MPKDKASSSGNLKFANKDLSKADMHGQDLRFADFRGATLIKANLSETNLTEADLREADCQGADLRKANMQGTFIRDANLRSADLSFVTNLLAMDVESAYIDKETKFPTYIQIKWKSEREYSCKDIIPREKSGRREIERRFKDKARLWGNRRKASERREEEDRRTIAKKLKEKKDKTKKVKGAKKK